MVKPLHTNITTIHKRKHMSLPAATMMNSLSQQCKGFKLGYKVLAAIPPAIQHHCLLLLENNGV